MTEFELKIKIGEALLELKGSKEDVDAMYDKLNGTFLANASDFNNAYVEKVPMVMSTQQPLIAECSDKGTKLSITQLKLKLGNALSERDWFLIYLYDYSNGGQNFVNKEDFKKYYLENRKSKSSTANYSNTLKSAIDFLNFDGDDDFVIKTEGIQRVLGLNDGTISVKPTKNIENTKNTKKPKSATAKFAKVDLNLDNERGFVDEFKSYSTKSITEAIFVLLKMYKDKTGNEEFSIDVIHSLLDFVSIDTPASLIAMMNNFVNSDKTFERPETNVYKFKYKGIDKAVALMEEKEN